MNSHQEEEAESLDLNAKKYKSIALYLPSGGDQMAFVPLLLSCYDGNSLFLSSCHFYFISSLSISSFPLFSPPLFCMCNVCISV